MEVSYDDYSYMILIMTILIMTIVTYYDIMVVINQGHLGSGS